VLAWLYTGPLGHLAAGVADWAELLSRHLIRSRRRDNDVLRGSSPNP
jgi:hypothetical protein